MKRFFAKLKPVLFFVVLAVLGSATIRGRAATLVVTSTADNGSGSLRDALASATNGDTIDATGISGTIVLLTGELPITNSVTIRGPGPGSLAIDGNYPNVTNRVFKISNATSIISGLTITNGNSSAGGGILALSSVLMLSNCVVCRNRAGTGGGIQSAGFSNPSTLTIYNSTFSGNSADVGGGIYSQGEPGPASLVIVGSTVISNTAGGAGAGGIKNDGSPSGNATAYITNCSIIGNSSGYGGGLQNDGFQGNATMFVVKCLLYGNVADPGGTGPGGGAIFNNDGSGNKVTVINCTLSGNSSGFRGGAIANGSLGGSGMSVKLLSSTLSDNNSTLGGGIFNIGSVELGNTILNAGASGSNIFSIAGGVVSDGYNVCSDSSSGFLTNSSDRTNLNPMLGPLQDNGGPTLTHAPLPGSPAIDQGNNLSGDSTDQRGFPRVYDDPAIPNALGGDATDAGAVEKAFELRFTGIEKLSENLRLSFTTFAGKNYEIESRTNFALGNWLPLSGTITGTGSNVQTTITNAFASPEQYFRIHQLQ